MSKHIAYLFQGQNLVVNTDLDLPLVDAGQYDLFIELAKDKIIVRDIRANTPLPEGFQLVPIRELIMYWTVEEFEQASKAKQLLEWKRNHRFCSHCGEKTVPHKKEFAMICPACHYHQYPRVQPCIITIITRQNEILLAKANRPNNDMYGLIAGFVEVGETLEQAVHREIAEEVGIKVNNLTYLSSQPWPFPSNLMIAFHAEYESGDIILQPEEILEADFFNYDQLPKIPTSGSIAHKMIKATAHNLSKIYTELNPD
ncbi:NAD(+) diphosphatase [Acinetobacter qingfengensis]|uniref:NAD(+) diphosphatase n=1 Tax=Acinetobacter qingfengensis TaxID=1262585 RepID=A0A1E7R843_9GAMM|nr:NAD(+) diphosphatase [Acinetobacter qingfengensis]KAA8731419.1 NAD(+) diphosphatase [Acinetobacter qingfengensis]OEY95520.1 NADH pyrophosphatase [Acinetobacter qingfengensis]